MGKTSIKKEFMQMAINEAFSGLKINAGGPFGAILVCRGKVVSRAHNEVLKSHDPTAHAEILAIRRAAKKLKRFDLSDCEIYSTCEPCPMCLTAIYWARIKTLYYGCNKEDTVGIGFADNDLYDIIRNDERKNPLKSIQIGGENCLKLFKAWEEKQDKIQY